MDPILLGTLIALTYGMVLFGLIKLGGVKYTEITKTTANIKNGILMPVGIATIALIAVSALNGWLMPAMTPAVRNAEPWMWVVPGAILLGIIVRLSKAKWQGFSPRGILYLLVGISLVGISEELLTRGLVVHFFTQSGIPQYAIMLGSSVLFGLLHGMNYFNGQDRKTTISQMIFTSIMGMALYTSLIVSGTLWVPIALHMLFDVSLLAFGHTDPHAAPRTPSRLELISTLVFYSGAIIVAINFIAKAVFQ